METTSTDPRVDRAITLASAERVLIEGAIEMLLLFLDEMDGDADLEDEPLEHEHDGREPEECFEISLGWTQDFNQRHVTSSGWDNGDREGPEFDKEASLGWTMVMDQTYLHCSWFVDDSREGEHDGREPEPYR